MIVSDNSLGKPMSDLRKLEDLYNREIKIDDDEVEFYRGLLNAMIQFIIPEMKRASPDFANLFRNIYYGGSFFDGLKVGSTPQEFDLNVLFKWSPNHCEITNLDKDKKNFALLQVTKQNLTPSEMKIVENTGNMQIISPVKVNIQRKSPAPHILITRCSTC